MTTQWPIFHKLNSLSCQHEWETQAKIAFPVVLSRQSDHILVRRRINWIVWLMWWRLFASRSAHLLASTTPCMYTVRWCVKRILSAVSPKTLVLIYGVGVFCKGFIARRLTSKISPGRLLFAEFPVDFQINRPH
jgi:hypothetical protein